MFDSDGHDDMFLMNEKTITICLVLFCRYICKFISSQMKTTTKNTKRTRMIHDRGVRMNAFVYIESLSRVCCLCYT